MMTTHQCNLSDIELNNRFEMGRKLNCKRQNNRIGNGASSFLDGPDNKQIKMTDNNFFNRTAGLEIDCNSSEARVIRDEPKLSKEDPQETRHLKQLLLLHLDWIQQQQESLIAKDRQIQRLKQDKDNLKCRLERMDRRMSLLKSRNRHSPSPQHEARESRSRVHSPAPSISKAENQAKGVKRKHSLEPQNLGKRFDSLDDQKTMKSPLVNRSTSTESFGAACAESEQTSNSTPTKSKSRMSRSHKDLTHKADSYLFSQQPLRRCRVLNSTSLCEEPDPELKPTDKKTKSRLQHNDSDTDEEIQFKDRSKPKQTRKSHSKCDTTSTSSKTTKILHTDTLYYVPVQTNLAPWEISPKKSHSEEVLVPNYRVRHIPTGYQLEGTENLTDEAFTKRHQKPELDEKRRKRWDAQMMREQKMLERLQQRGNSTGKVVNYGKAPSSKTGAEEEFYSFLPDPDNVQYVEICEEVPVSAFGYPVPSIQPTEFSLPWYEMEYQARSDRGKTRSTRKR